MKLKYISKLLISSILVSNLNITSFAGILSADGRYETFEGSNIVVNDNLEEYEIDVEVKGSTMVNLLKGGKSATIAPAKPADFKLAASIVPGKKYTIVFHADVSRVYGGFIVNDSTWGNRFNQGEAVSGLNKLLITTTDSYKTFRIRHDSNKVNLKNVMLLEGDWTDKEIPEYFEGIKSVGEYEDGNHSIELKSQNENLFLGFDHSGFKIKETINDRVLINEYNNKNIPLNEPLRALPNGVEDRIVKKNSQWFIERNCSEITFDGDENWIKTGVGCNDIITTFTYEFNPQNLKSVQIWGPWQTKEAISNELNCIGDELYFNTVTNEGFAQGHLGSASTDRWYIGVSNDRLSSLEVSAFKNWLAQNPTTIVYQLATPIYEPLNIGSTINLYLDTTYISNNSIIPANMKIVVDRTPNRAKESIELAKSHSTIENLSNARYWTNLMRESILKDSFQTKVNNITDIEDLSIEKKSVTANSDIYIKPKNMLSVSLDTNSIIFDEVDATEDTERLNAVNLSVVSSLPYKINAYLEEEIYNNDKSETLDRSSLNIKANVTDTYKIFTDLSSPLTLLDDQDAGMNNSHGVDLKLVFNSVPKVDIYKTVIKFEVEQK